MRTLQLTLPCAYLQLHRIGRISSSSRPANRTSISRTGRQYLKAGTGIDGTEQPPPYSPFQTVTYRERHTLWEARPPLHGKVDTPAGGGFCVTQLMAQFCDHKFLTDTCSA